MPSTQQFRKRIKSVQSTRQITKAMEMIASIKMQKAVKAILSNRSYMQHSWHLLTKLANLTSRDKHPLLHKREVKKICIVLAGADRGLCGSYNSDLNRQLSALLKSQTIQQFNEATIDIIATGKKAAEVAKKTPGLTLAAEFPSFELDVEFWQSRPVSKIILDGYLNGTYDQVILLYSHFESSLKQTPIVKQLLPIEENHVNKPELWEIWDEPNNLDYKFEPDIDTLLERTLPLFIKAQVWGAMLESNASEHSARMVAMKSATDNAKELIDDLKLTYNSIRQDSITREIAEISGAAEAMK